jgi:uncharacterized membrane protein
MRQNTHGNATTAEAAHQRFLLCGAICFIVLAGAWLRFHDLGVDSIWRDEAASWQQSKDNLADLIHRTAQDNYPPLHNLCLFVAIKLFGDGEWSLRLPSAIFGTTNLVAIYWLGRRAGLLAAAFLALSGFHIWYSQEARMYALLSLAATLFVAASSFYFFRSPTLPRAALVSLAALALLYSHPFGLLNWMAIVAAICLSTQTPLTFARWTLATWAASNLIAVAGFAPWAWLLLKRPIVIESAGFWIPYPSLESVYHGLIGMVGGPFTAVLLIVGLVLALLPTRQVLPARYAPHGEEPRAQIDFLPVFFVWAGLPIVTALLISSVSTPIFLPRYLIGSLPALLLAAAFGLSRFLRDWLGYGLTGLSLVIPTVSYAYVDKPYREDWRGPSALLAKQLRPSDCVLLGASGIVALHYYFRKELSCLLPSTPLRVENISGDRLFAVLGSHQDRRDQIIATLHSALWSVQQQVQFRNIDVIELGKSGP